MSQRPSFWFKKQPQAGLAELVGAIEFIPQAVLVIDAYTQRVQAANKQAIKLFNISYPNIVEKTLAELVRLPEDFVLSSATSPDPAPVLAELIPLDRPCQDVTLRLSSLSPTSEFCLVSIEPETSHQSPKEAMELHTKFWQGMNLLANAADQADFDQSLRSALEGARTLVQCEYAQLYLCTTNNDPPASSTDRPTIPLANRHAYRWGSDESLPETVAAQDLVMLRTIRLWDHNKRPTTSLHRAAREAGFAYLAVAPLGLPHKLSGLIALGDKEHEASQDILRVIQFVAMIFTHIIENYEFHQHIDRTVDSNALQLRVSDAALAVVQDGVFVLSPDLHTRRINLAAETILGYKNREVENQPIDQILIGSNALLPALKLAQEGSPTYHLNDVKLLRRYGDPFQALVRVQPILTQGAVESILVIVRDLSEQAAYEAHARQLAQNAELGEVMAAFAHEVRNPINNISSGLQVMARTIPEGDPQREEVRMLLLDIDRVDELMKSMLSATRTTDLKPRQMDLGQLLKSMLDRLKPSISRDNISCQTSIEPGLPPIYGDARALEQVFNNLIRNAIQALKGRPDSQLIVKIQTQKAAKERIFLEVSIADNGPGIPKENLDKIFQPFFTTKADGNGLGLPLSKRIITAHKGSITVTSFPGGTVFRVILPAFDRSRQTGPLPSLDAIYPPLTPNNGEQSS